MPGYVMTTLEAQQVLDAFGPCTSLYECTDRCDLIADASYYDSLFDMLDTLVHVEQCHADRFLGGIADSGEGDHKGACDEWHRMEERIKLALSLTFPGYDYDARREARWNDRLK